MSSTPAEQNRSTATRGAIGAGLLLAGLLCLALWRVLSNTENLAFAEGASSPRPAQVTSGNSYSISVPGGAPAMIAHGVFGQPGSTLSLSCDWSIGRSVAQSLQVEAEATNTKAETTVGRFVAPVSGRISITCANWGPVYVSDADDVASDPSGWFLIAAMIALTLGAGFALSAARSASLGSGRSRDDEEIERFVDLGSFGGDDGEVGGDERSDVLT